MISKKQMKHILKLAEFNRKRNALFGHNRYGIPHNKKSKKKISIGNKGEKNGMWKGDKVGYFSLHEWIKKYKSKSKLCEKCKVVTVRERKTFHKIHSL